MYKNLKAKFEEHFQEIIRTKHNPHSVAFGFALGTFISILPTPGLNFALSFLLVLIFKKINKYSLFFSLIFWNVLTLAPIYLLSIKIGSFIFGPSHVVTYEITLIDKIFFFTRRFLVGNLIVATFLSLAFYFFVLFLYKKYYASIEKIK